MKNTIVHLFAFIILMTCVSCNNQRKQVSHNVQESPAEQTTGPIAIHLNNLSPLKTNLYKCSLREIEGYGYGYIPYDNKLVVHSAMQDTFLLDNGHPFINSIRTAYACHRPLVLSPDAVWITIAHGFAYHVSNCSEQLREKLVTHEDTITLSLYCEPGLIDMPAEKWEPFFSQFTEQMNQWTDSGLVELLTCNFTTTTPASYVASQITTMSALQSYFKYQIIESCGIPTIYLEGTQEDWQRIVQKAHALRQYDLDWWMDELEPVLQKFADASAGEVDTVFWQSICKKTDLPVNEEIYCGLGDPTEKVNGWVLKFYPYYKDGQRSSFTEMDDNDIELLPMEVSSAPLEYIDLNDETLNLELAAGFVGIIEDSATLSLRPQIVWYVTKEEHEEE